MIDLHTHSTASDGTLTPAQLVNEADKTGLAAVALTDHDTADGINEFMDKAAQSPVEGVPGVEVAADWYGGSLHIVGLYIDPDNTCLSNLLEQIREHRQERNTLILERLEKLGAPVSESSVNDEVFGEVTGRPHIARALVEQGHCRTQREAFEMFLGSHAPAYIQRRVPSPQFAVEAIHAARGVAVWAHPTGLGERPRSKIKQTLRKLKDIGLDGVEAYYSEYTAEQESWVLQLAQEHGLLLSGGSDFHGENFPSIALGKGHGALRVPNEILVPLRKRAGDYQMVK